MKKFIAKKPEKEVISLRIPSEILKIIDKKATEVEISRNELINQMILYSLQNMDVYVHGGIFCLFIIDRLWNKCP